MHTAMCARTVAREWTVHDGSAFAFNVLRGIARAPNEARYNSLQRPDSDTFGPPIPTKVATLATCDKLPKPGMANAETQPPQMNDELLAEYEAMTLHPSPLVSKTANTLVIPKRSASPP
jgi:hypothetical protein